MVARNQIRIIDGAGATIEIEPVELSFSKSTQRKYFVQSSGFGWKPSSVQSDVAAVTGLDSLKDTSIVRWMLLEGLVGDGAAKAIRERIMDEIRSMEYGNVLLV